MIISHFWLPLRNPPTRPREQFIALVTNLEKEKLRFRFTFKASQADGVGNADCTAYLRGWIHPVLELGVASPPHELDLWDRRGRVYVMAYEVVIDAGETMRSGIEIEKPVTLPPNPHPVFEPDGFLRGHWELTLPPKPLPPGSPQTAPRVPQRDKPARVAVTALRHFDVLDADGHADHQVTAVFPNFAGVGELEIPADRGTIVATTAPSVGVSTALAGARAKRAARKRKATRRRR